MTRDVKQCYVFSLVQGSNSSQFQCYTVEMGVGFGHYSWQPILYVQQETKFTFKDRCGVRIIENLLERKGELAGGRWFSCLVYPGTVTKVFLCMFPFFFIRPKKDCFKKQLSNIFMVRLNKHMNSMYNKIYYCIEWAFKSVKQISQYNMCIEYSMYSTVYRIIIVSNTISNE